MRGENNGKDYKETILHRHDYFNNPYFANEFWYMAWGEKYIRWFLCYYH